nr:hypothetical protein [Tanacetum cinerariifolium]
MSQLHLMDPAKPKDGSRCWWIRRYENIFETYVKAKDLDLWHVILNDDFPLIAKNKVTQVLEVVPFEKQNDDLKRKLAKNIEAKMVLRSALPKKEYEIIFMCKTAKDIWQSLLITHQESIDSGFARFNTIITSLKAFDESFSSKNYVRKFLRDLHPKWGAKRKKERVKSIALKAKKESSDDETSTSGSDDEEYVMAVRNFKKFFRRKGKFVRQPREEKNSFRQRDEKNGKSDQKCFRCCDPNHLIGDYPKPPRNKDQKASIGGFNSSKASTSGTKPISFVGSSVENATDGSTVKSKYIKEMLKKFGLEDSKPTKTPMSTKIKLTMDDEADSVDSTKYR